MTTPEQAAESKDPAFFDLSSALGPERAGPIRVGSKDRPLWARITGKVGGAMIVSGLVILGFVAYQLWGTGYFERRDQTALKKQFVETAGIPVAAPDAPAKLPDKPVPAPEATPVGDAVAILQIPKIGIDDAIVEGVGVGDLRKGPGHYPHTPLPGQPGNASIAGHRTTYGAPFYSLDQLGLGDSIFVTTKQGRFEYKVAESKVVRPSDVSVVKNTNDNRLTLTTCNPRFSATTRLVVVANLVGTAAQGKAITGDPTAGLGKDFGESDNEAGSPEDQATTTPPNPGTSTTLSAAQGTGGVLPADGSTDEAIADAGLGGNAGARVPALIFALCCLVVGSVTWTLARRYSRWRWLLIYPLGIVPFAVFLLAFYVELARTLPANF